MKNPKLYAAMHRFQLAAMRNAERRDAAGMAELCADRARRDQVVLAERVLTRSQQMRRAFYRMPLVDVAEVF